jgi:hypothetical protein
MDILGARDVASGDKPIPAPDPEAYTFAERWIQKAIDIEERQCVIFVFIISILIFQRIDLQDRLRRLPKNPREEDLKQTEELHSSINAEFARLEALQRQVSDIMPNLLTRPEKDEAAAFDDLDEDESCYVLVQAYALKERCCDLTSA